MHCPKLTAACLVLTVSQLATAAGPPYHPVQPIRPCCANLNHDLTKTVKITPTSVLTYEPSTSLWVATPRLRVTDPLKSERDASLRERLIKDGSVVVPSSLVEPAWMLKYRDISVLSEDPLLRK